MLCGPALVPAYRNSSTTSSRVRKETQTPQCMDSKPVSGSRLETTLTAAPYLSNKLPRPLPPPGPVRASSLF